MVVQEVEPQTIEAEDGFPIPNEKHCFEAHEIMAVVQKNKPVSVTIFNEDYKHTKVYRSITKNGKTEYVLVPTKKCKKYTYKQVYNQSKKVDLYYYPGNRSSFFFLKENIKKGYILWKIWDTQNSLGFPPHTEKIYDIWVRAALI